MIRVKIFKFTVRVIPTAFVSRNYITHQRFWASERFDNVKAHCLHLLFEFFPNLIIDPRSAYQTEKEREREREGVMGSREGGLVTQFELRTRKARVRRHTCHLEPPTDSRLLHRTGIQMKISTCQREDEVPVKGKGRGTCVSCRI